MERNRDWQESYIVNSDFDRFTIEEAAVLLGADIPNSNWFVKDEYVRGYEQQDSN